VYGMIEALLKVNPEAAKYRKPHDANILHWACWSYLPSKLCIDIMKLVLALHKDAVQEADNNGNLPVHCAAGQCALEVVEFLLGLYPEEASYVLTSDGQNLLDLAAADDASNATPKVQYLCSRYPAMTQQRDWYGMMPVHNTMHYGYKTALALYEAGGIEQFKTPTAHPTNTTYELNGYLPLHFFIRHHAGHLKTDSPATSEAADMFPWLLRLYPEAAGIEGGVGAYRKTPYQLAVDKDFSKYFLRLLLRAAPTLNPAELHRLNYAERRMAMFLAFKAVTARLQKPFLLARLRGVDKDLVQRVTTFL
jgi:hypothetical protein